MRGGVLRCEVLGERMFTAKPPLKGTQVSLEWGARPDGAQGDGNAAGAAQGAGVIAPAHSRGWLNHSLNSMKISPMRAGPDKEIESLLIPAHPRSSPRPAYAQGFGGLAAQSAVARRAKAESGDPGPRTPALVALDSRVRGNERNML